MLCENLIALTIPSAEEQQLCEPEKYVFGHHPSIESLQRAQAQGCVLCKEIHLREGVNPTFEAFDYYSVFTFFLESTPGSPPMMIVYWGEETEYAFHEMVKYEGKLIRHFLFSPVSLFLTFSILISRRLS